ncbi:alpha/beta fold hydrolase [Nocardia gamkensis]|uniref:alpha/beta fold hydrolase n=1 Tax=Nocardia gamkensis TaxID=352869 RepID=UPI0037C6601B
MAVAIVRTPAWPGAPGSGRRDNRDPCALSLFRQHRRRFGRHRGGGRAALEVPTSVLFCDRDRVIPPARYGRRIVAEIPTITAITLPEVGHVPMLEAPLLVAGEIGKVID